MSDREGDAPRRGDENPLGRRRAMESRRLRPVVEDAPLPEKVEPAPSRRLNVVKASEVAAPAPAELPPAWLPPRVEEASRRIKPAASSTPSSSPPTTAPTTRPRPPLALLAASGALALLGVVVGVVDSMPPSLEPTRFDAAQRAALTEAWRGAGLTTWGGARTEPALLAHVGGIASKVLGPDVKVLIVGSKTSAHAMLMPDGSIVVSAALLWQLKSDAELAAVLAHTGAHLEAGHLARILDDIDDDTAARVVDGLATPTAKDVSVLLVGLAERGGTSAFWVDDEAVADAIAVARLDAAGYPRSALVEVVKRFSADNHVPWGRQHTTVAQRRLHLDELVVAGGGPDEGPEVIAADTYTTVVLAALDRERPEVTADPMPDQGGGEPDAPDATAASSDATSTPPATTADVPPPPPSKSKGKGEGNKTSPRWPTKAKGKGKAAVPAP